MCRLSFVNIAVSDGRPSSCLVINGTDQLSGLQHIIHIPSDCDTRQVNLLCYLFTGILDIPVILQETAYQSQCGFVQPLWSGRRPGSRYSPDGPAAYQSPRPMLFFAWFKYSFIWLYFQERLGNAGIQTVLQDSQSHRGTEAVRRYPCRWQRSP